MADDVTLPGTGAVVATDDVGGRQFQVIKLDVGGNGASTPVSGAVPVSGPLTDTELRATAVPVSGPLTDGQLRATAVPVSGPLTDAQLRATAVPVSGTVTASGPLTDAQLRASAVPVSAASLPLPTGAATETTLAALNGKIPAAGQTTMSASQPVVIASDQTAIPTVENALFVTGAAAQTATVNNILTDPSGSAATEVTNYRSMSVQVASTGTGGTFIFEQSNDGTNFVALPVFNAALVTGVPITAAITATNSNLIYTFPIRCRYVRLRIATTITGGSIRAHSRFSTEPWTAAAQLVASNTAGNMLVQFTQPALVAGTAAIGDVGMQYRANATGAATITNILCPATPAAQQIRSGAGRLIAISLSNSSASTRWLKLWNTLGASVTVGTTAAITEIAIPAGQTLHLQLEGGYAFGTAITCAITGGQGLTNNTAVTLGDVTGFTAHA